MPQPSIRIVPLLTFLAVFAALSGTAEAQRVGDHPNLRAALHELREARAELKGTRDVWPTGYRDLAIASIDDAIESVATLLAVQNIREFRGVERGAVHYKRFANYPHLRIAVLDLRLARAELRTSKGDFKGRKEQALDDIDIAIGDILKLIKVGTNPSTTSVVVSSRNPSNPGEGVIFSVRVGDADNVATSGTVSFFDGPNFLGFGVFDARSQWTLTVPTLAPGRHSITATYRGNFYYARSSSPTPLSQIVQRGR